MCGQLYRKKNKTQIMGLTLTFSLQWAFLTPLCLLPQGSLSCHAPKDQAYSQILEHVYSQLSNVHWVHLGITVLVLPWQEWSDWYLIRKPAFIRKNILSMPWISQHWCKAWLPNRFILSWENTQFIFEVLNPCDPCRLCLPMRHKIRWHWRRGRAGKQENKNQRVADDNWSI